MTLTTERLREELDYDPATGTFRWRVSRPGVSAGNSAGSLGSRGYGQIKVARRNYLAHRLAWLHVYGEWPAAEVDHINGDRGDNRIENLRSATRAQNSANARRPSGNTSGFKGTSRHQTTGRWQARIKINGQARHLGLFDTAGEAHAAYLAAAREHFGEFARAA